MLFEFELLFLFKLYGVLLSGAVNSPQILLNSGIGPKKELESVKVPVVHDLPGVGKNFHDHVGYILTMSVNEKGRSALNWTSIMEYFYYRKGPLSSIGDALYISLKILNSITFLRSLKSLSIS